MQQYIQIIKNTWAEMMTYRLNFILWRVRMVLQLLVTYFLWFAIFSGQKELFGYKQSMILTYVLLSNIIRTIVLGTTTMEIGQIINNGVLSNFLIRPINFFKYYIAKDIGDKLLNFGFSLIEITILIVILRPPIFFQSSPMVIVLALIAAALGMVLYFYFSLALGIIGFWSPDIWAPRFLSFVIMEFFAGGLFPLDILPKPLFLVSQSLPFYYFIYFPLKVYLGQLTFMSMVTGFLVGLCWVGAFIYLVGKLWNKGLRVYTAEGR